MFLVKNNGFYIDSKNGSNKRKQPIGNNDDATTLNSFANKNKTPIENDKTHKKEKIMWTKNAMKLNSENSRAIRKNASTHYADASKINNQTLHLKSYKNNKVKDIYTTRLGRSRGISERMVVVMVLLLTTVIGDGDNVLVSASHLYHNQHKEQRNQYEQYKHNSISGNNLMQEGDKVSDNKPLNDNNNYNNDEYRDLLAKDIQSFSKVLQLYKATKLYNNNKDRRKTETENLKEPLNNKHLQKMIIERIKGKASELKSPLSIANSLFVIPRLFGGYPQIIYHNEEDLNANQLSGSNIKKKKNDEQHKQEQLTEFELSKGKETENNKNVTRNNYLTESNNQLIKLEYEHHLKSTLEHFDELQKALEKPGAIIKNSRLEKFSEIGTEHGNKKSQFIDSKQPFKNYILNKLQNLQKNKTHYRRFRRKKVQKEEKEEDDYNDKYGKKVKLPRTKGTHEMGYFPPKHYKRKKFTAKPKNIDALSNLLVETNHKGEPQMEAIKMQKDSAKLLNDELTLSNKKFQTMNNVDSNSQHKRESDSNMEATYARVCPRDQVAVLVSTKRNPNDDQKQKRKRETLEDILKLIQVKLSEGNNDNEEDNYSDGTKLIKARIHYIPRVPEAHPEKFIACVPIKNGASETLKQTIRDTNDEEKNEDVNPEEEALVADHSEDQSINVLESQHSEWVSNFDSQQQSLRSVDKLAKINQQLSETMKKTSMLFVLIPAIVDQETGDLTILHSLKELPKEINGVPIGVDDVPIYESRYTRQPGSDVRNDGESTHSASGFLYILSPLWNHRTFLFLIVLIVSAVVFLCTVWTPPILRKYKRQYEILSTAKFT